MVHTLFGPLILVRPSCPLLSLSIPCFPPKTSYHSIDLLLRELGEYRMIQCRIIYESSPPILSKETHCTCKEPACSTNRRMVPRHALCLDTPRQHVKRMAPRHAPSQSLAIYRCGVPVESLRDHALAFSYSFFILMICHSH